MLVFRGELMEKYVTVTCDGTQCVCVCEGREAGKVGSECVMREEAGYRDAHVPKNFKIINKVCPVTTAMSFGLVLW